MGQGLIWWLGSMAGAAAVTAFVSRRWVWQAALLYLASPLILFLGWVGWELATRRGAEAGLGMAVFALAMVSSIAALPWFVTCLVGFGLGLVPRRWIRPPVVAPAAPRPVGDWRPVHVGVTGDALAIHGVEIWKHPWRPAGLPPVALPHPAHPQQILRFDIYDAGVRFGSQRFAAAELSAGVWSFHVPGSADVVDEECLSADGSLRYVRRRLPPHFNLSVATLSDVATGAIYFEDARLEFVRFVEQADGTLVLELADHYQRGSIHIDPRARVFRLARETGAGRPLASLNGAVGEALMGSRPTPGMAVAAPAPARRPVAWRSLVAISLAAAVAIAVASYVTARVTPPVPTLTPMPRMPGAKG